MFSYVTDDLHSRLDEIMASKMVIDTSRGPMWFRYPYADDRLYARHLFGKAKQEYEKDGIPNINEARKEHLECGLWTDEQEQSLNKLLPDYIEQITVKLSTEKNLIRKRKYELKLRELNNKLSELSNAYNQLMINTSEFMAYRAAIAFMVWRCFSDIDGERLWKKYDDILAENDIGFVEELINAFNKSEEIDDMSLVRQLARSAQWRVRWKCAENNLESLFGRPAKDLTITQFMLVYWSQMYDSVYDSLERPPQSTIENDEALDKWLERRSKEMEREISQKFESSSSTIKNSKIANAPEVFRVVSGYYNDDGEFVLYTDEERWEQIERMRNLNSDFTRAAQRATEERLEKTPGILQPEQRIKNKHIIEATGGTITKKGKGR